MIILQETQAGDGMTVRLVERPSADFVILYLTPRFAAITHRTVNRADAHRWYFRAVELADSDFTHPAWRNPSTTRTIPINGD